MPFQDDHEPFHKNLERHHCLMPTKVITETVVEKSASSRNDNILDCTNYIVEKHVIINEMVRNMMINFRLLKGDKISLPMACYIIHR